MDYCRFIYAFVLWSCRHFTHQKNKSLVEAVFTHFPDLTDIQRHQFVMLSEIYEYWNSKINVISRKDIEHLYIHHVLHSLAIGKYIALKAGSTVLDLGSGGGFPGIPLAILFPNAIFHMIDARAKKLTVIQQVIESISLNNCSTEHVRAEDHKEKYDFVVSRAVSKLHVLWKWSLPLIHLEQKNSIPNGLITLKGGDLKEEIKQLSKKTYYEIEQVSCYFKDPYFEEKKLVYVQR